MLLLPHLDVFEAMNGKGHLDGMRKALKILYNNSLTLCLSSRYISLLEEAVSNKDVFQALIVELNDSKRIKIEKTLNENDLRQEFIEISTTCKESNFMALVMNDDTNLAKEIGFLVDTSKEERMNRHWVSIELLSNNIMNASFKDFQDNEQIINFFGVIFSIPKFIGDVLIFNRDKTSKFLAPLRGKRIYYYTILTGGRRNEYQLKEDRKELSRELGGRLQFYYTTDKRIIHERKIIFGNFLLTMDNSFENINFEEPTWEILLSFDESKSKKWQEKCSKFVPL